MSEWTNTETPPTQSGRYIVCMQDRFGDGYRDMTWFSTQHGWTAKAPITHWMRQPSLPEQQESKEFCELEKAQARIAELEAKKDIFETERNSFLSALKQAQAMLKELSDHRKYQSNICRGIPDENGVTLDGTEGACPAWWRGVEHGWNKGVHQLNETTAANKIFSDTILKLQAECDRYREALEEIKKILNWANLDYAVRIDRSLTIILKALALAPEPKAENINKIIRQSIKTAGPAIREGFDPEPLKELAKKRGDAGDGMTEAEDAACLERAKENVPGFHEGIDGALEEIECALCGHRHIGGC